MKPRKSAAGDATAARLVVSRVLDADALRPQQPALGRPGRIPGTRELTVAKTRYIVPYRLRGETTEILRTFHTSRRLPDRWWASQRHLDFSPRPGRDRPASISVPSKWTIELCQPTPRRST